jgi:hypothetical protein
LAAACVLAQATFGGVMGTAAPAQVPPGCESASIAYLALGAQRETDRASYRTCLADRRQDCRGELQQLRTTEDQLRLLGTYLRNCSR